MEEHDIQQKPSTTHDQREDGPARPGSPSPAAPAARKRRTARLMALVLLALAFTALALSWRFTPLREMVDLRAVADWVQGWRSRPWFPLAVPVMFTVGGLLAVPLNAMTIATVLGMGPMLGAPLALMGGVTSGAVGYMLGHQLGAGRTERLLGERVDRLRRQVVRGGLWAVIAIRVVPVAPYTVVNLVAGALRLHFGRYLIGTAIGLLPGVLTLALVGEGLWSLFEGASPYSIIAALSGALAVLIGAVALRRWVLGQRREER